MDGAVDNNFYLSIGAEITGFAEKAIAFGELPERFKSKKGLDNVVWIKQNMKGMELEGSVFLSADSPSVKALKVLEKTDAVVPFIFLWESIGITVDALDCIVQEVGGLEVGTDSPDIEFKFKLKNFVEMKGL